MEQLMDLYIWAKVLINFVFLTPDNKSFPFMQMCVALYSNVMTLENIIYNLLVQERNIGNTCTINVCSKIGYNWKTQNIRSK